MFTIAVVTHFDAGHHLPGYMGKCAQRHGHRWDVRIEFYTEEDADEETGMLVDFQSLKEPIGFLDHSYLNDKLEGIIPTAENVVRWIWCKLAEIIDLPGQLSVTLWESPQCSVAFEGGINE